MLIWLTMAGDFPRPFPYSHFLLECILHLLSQAPLPTV